MSDTSRRRFIGVAGAGAAAVGATVAVPGTAFAGQARRSAKSADESVVAWVSNHKTHELTLLVGDREVVVHDRDLVTRILNAAGGK